ncbi:MAG: DUF2442 domain-containing protein [Gemmatimonadota bacterium]
MTTLHLETEPLVVRVDVADEHLRAHLADGRIIAVPLSWYPRLVHASPEERGNYEIGGRGRGIHWPDLDEDVSVENLLEGRRSAESEASLEHWIAGRRRAEG